MNTLSNCWMHWKRSSRFSFFERNYTKWLKQNERRSVWRSLRACNEWKKVVESLIIEQSTFKHVTRRAKSSENRNTVNIERSCRTLNNSRENCSKLRNKQEMQLQTHWLKRQFSLWFSQSASTLLRQRRIRRRWCFRFTFHHLQRFSCWTQKTSSNRSQLRIMFCWCITRLRESFTRWCVTRFQDIQNIQIK